ncbi:chromate efflux transporter [Luteimonas aestuarii]|uniref:Chromate efflux transporter n=1 Tax=Luteimonas aestuarii TaxID=453837 RepID=A0A4R5TRP2_9GAMM|nr:chromate efflux transporter [Luteimonas aestuarii]TDK20653.1 chromate efflux transporter [Luteimonas aestuarii]
MTMEAWRVFAVFLRLGLTSFGGPIAHLGYFREAFVTRLRWLRDDEYAELVAICQFLPGPASSQVGMAIGLRRAGLSGALAAWVGFTLPSALVMIGLALGVLHGGAGIPPGVVHGMKLVAVAVVAHAVWGMARGFCRTLPAALLTLACAVLLLAWPMAWMQWLVIAAGALVGLGWRSAVSAGEGPGFNVAVPRRPGAFALAAFALLFGLPLLGFASGSTGDVFSAFYRAGALVFGGGHVVMPLLDTAVVAPGWLSQDDFLAGYGAVQAVPGPLFTFAGYLGAAMSAGPGGWAGGVLALLAVFLPSLLLVLGVLPFWRHVRRWPRMRAALAGVNAAVVGLLLAALVDPVARSALLGVGDVLLVMAALVAMQALRVPAWGVVLAFVFGGWWFGG